MITQTMTLTYSKTKISQMMMNQLSRRRRRKRKKNQKCMKLLKLRKMMNRYRRKTMMRTLWIGS